LLPPALRAALLPPLDAVLADDPDWLEKSSPSERDEGTADFRVEVGSVDCGLAAYSNNSKHSVQTI